MSAPGRFGSVKGESPANKGRDYPAQPLTRAEADALISAAMAGPSRSGFRNAVLIIVMYRGGLRVSEALALRAADVNYEQATVRVLCGKNRKARDCAYRPSCCGHGGRAG